MNGILHTESPAVAWIEVPSGIDETTKYIHTSFVWRGEDAVKLIENANNFLFDVEEELLLNYVGGPPIIMWRRHPSLSRELETNEYKYSMQFLTIPALSLETLADLSNKGMPCEIIRP